MVRNESLRYIISLNVWLLSTACTYTQRQSNKNDSPAETGHTSSSFRRFYFLDLLRFILL